ncbi:hypothetical protein [Thalassotalea atypica]|uniref:hypothetical protein n=1 Tax=Thalassotalea atypica TaxID=2054316 RepID=UPI00257333FB|nr:hypothetical protein [Thalassotalea atypica]
MKLHEFLAITLSLVQFPIVASTLDYKLDFGVIIHNDNGEPIGFEKTSTIPIDYKGKSSLYGLVVTSPEDQQFSLNSVHVFPHSENEIDDIKLMGKPMLIQKRGAILLRTDLSDIPGNYKMEVYIDNKLHQTISYELVTNTHLSRL